MNITMVKPNSDNSIKFLDIGTEKYRGLRYTITGICFFLIFMFSFFYEMDKEYLMDHGSVFISFLRYVGQMDYLSRSLISGTLFLVAALCGLEPVNKPNKVNWMVLYIWFLMNATFIIAGISHDIQAGFVYSQISVFLCIPICYIGWMRSGHLKDLYALFSLAVVIFTVLMALSCIIWFPYGEQLVSGTTDTGSVLHSEKSTVFLSGNRYMGMMPNPSRIAHFATPGAICSLYLVFVWDGWKKLLPALTLGLSISMAVLSISRAAVASIGLGILAFLILYFREGQSPKKLIVVILIALLSLSASFSLVNRGQDNYKLLSKTLPAEATYADTNENNGDTAQDESSNIGKRFQVSGTINGVSSGRVGIWMTFFNHLNFSGHDIRYDYPLRVKDPDLNRYYYFAYPHNVALDYAYRCGIPTGVLFLMLEIAGLIYCGKKLFGRKRAFRDGEVFAVMGILAFMITGNVESVDHVFTRIILVVFYLSLIPVFAGKEN